MAEHTVITADRYRLRSGKEIQHIVIDFEAAADETCSEDIAAALGESALFGFLYAISAIGGDADWDLALHTPDDLDILSANMETINVANGKMYTPAAPIIMMTEITLEITGAGVAGTGTVELFIET